MQTIIFGLFRSRDGIAIVAKCESIVFGVAVLGIYDLWRK